MVQFACFDFKIIFSFSIEPSHRYVFLFIPNFYVTLLIKFYVMSVAEMKLHALEVLALLKDESAIREIYELLEKIQSNQKATTLNLSDKFDSISKRFDETLQKLAQ